MWVLERRSLEVGDKLTGRHGNKGVVSRILDHDTAMPRFLIEDTRRTVDVLLNPTGVVSRVNLGQILET
ncbi:hypothetical protein, partial [Proteus vulgaris]|uniref:hypothetical protein n=1 Tax=Proteus vulgaris TaxID=585 RepID=UPI0033384ECB